MKLRAITPALLFFVFLTITFEVLVRFGFVPSWMIPSPTQVAQTIFEMKDDFSLALLQTVQLSLVGLVLSFLIGNLLALVLISNRALESAISPIAIFFQTVPVIAIAPLIVIWFGFGSNSVMVCSLLVSFFPILANSLVGLKSTPEEWQELAQLYRLSKWQTLIKLRLPSAMIQIFSGLKIASGLSIVGAIVGEFVAGGGLGGLIDSARTQQRVDIVFAALFLSSLFGVFLLALITFIEAKLLSWRPFYSLGKR